MLKPRSLIPLRRILFAGCVVLVGLSSAVAQTSVSTLAGSSPAIASGNANAVGTAARFNALSSVAVDSAGNIYVADASNHTIRKVTAAGVVTTLAGSGAAGNANGMGAAASFRFPQGIATDNTNVYVADTYNHAIRQIVISNGLVTTLAGTVGTSGTANGTGVAATFNSPLGLAVSGTDLYVADTGSHTIRKIVISSGVVTTFAGTAGTNGFADGTGVAATFKNPGAIAAEGTTNLYVADTANHTIRKIVIGTALVTTLAGTANATGGSLDGMGADASFKLPKGLVVSGANLFVADTGNHTLRQIVLATGDVTTIAGTAGATGNTDAIGTAARFQGPKGIGVSTGGTLYIADTNNHTLRTGTAAVAPTVSDPANKTILVGANATFTATVTGNPTPTIQWERKAVGASAFQALANGAPYSGVTTATLTVTGAALATSGDQFRATVTNGVGSAVSSSVPAVLTVYTIPAITTQPITQTIVAGSPVTLTVVATGSPVPNYQWKKGGENIPGATGSSFTIAARAFSDTGSYTVVVTNIGGSVTSTAATLTVNVPPSITSQPITQTIVAGSSVRLMVEATGFPAPTYQWKKGGVNIAGATGLNYTIAAPAFSDTGSYTVVVTNIGGSVTSTAATLTVNVPPSITTQPQTQTIVAGSPVTLTVVATGSPTPTYQWKKDGLILAGSTSATLSPAALQPADSGSYAVVVTNAVSSVSSVPAVLTFYTLPAITTQPTTQTIVAGSPVTLTVVATGSPVPTYQWKKGGVNIAGATGSSFTIAASAATDTGSYTVVVTNIGGFVTSTTATLTVNVPPSITTQPQSAASKEGQVATFTVVATGIPTPTIQWERQAIGASAFQALANGAPYSGVTTATLTVTGAALATSGDQFRARVVNGVGSAVSDEPVLTVYTIPTITTQPTTQTIVAGNPVTLSVVATGSPVPNYQWKKGGGNIPGATGSSFTIAASAATDTGSYTVVVTNIGGFVTSTTATLTVNVPPSITTQPQSAAATAGLGADFTVGATGIPTPTYQWKKDGLILPGSTRAILSLAGLQPADSGSYAVVVTNAASSVSSVAATLTVTATPIVNATAFGRYVLSRGQSMTLQLDPAITGATIQWLRNGMDISGATSREGTASSPGYYQARYTVGAQTVTSEPIFVQEAASRGQLVAWGSNAAGETTIPSGLGSATTIVSGNGHTVALKSDGTLAAWGANTNGQATIPTGLVNIVGVAAGGFHNVALKTDGAVVAWGLNSAGQATVPTELSNVLAVAAGYYHSLAVGSDGTVVGWGYDDYGQATSPSGLTGVATVAAGYYHSLALKSDGTVVAWGSNFYGQTAVPSGLSGVVEVAAGSAHNLVLKSDRTVVAWGANDFGQATVPSGLSGVVAIAAGQHHSLALKSDGTVIAWGKNSEGQTALPVGLNHVRKIAGGNGFSIVLRESAEDTVPIVTTPPASRNAFVGQDVTLNVGVSAGTGYALGYQWRKAGAVIVGATGAALSLLRVSATDAGGYDVVISNWLGSVTSVAASVTVNPAMAVAMNPAGLQVLEPGQSLELKFSTLLPSALGEVVTYQWRRNSRPIAGATTVTYTLEHVATGDSGYYQVVVTNATGPLVGPAVFVRVEVPTEVRAWGDGGFAQTTVPSGLSGVVGLAAGGSHSVALKSDGSVVAWGNNDFGQTKVPSGLSGVVAVAAGGSHSLALKSDGTVLAWGNNNYGQTTIPSGLSGVVAVAAAVGGNHSLALKSDGRVVAWGHNGYGQTTIPSGLSGVVAVTGGGGHSVALKSDGSVVAWGYNNQGQTTIPSGLTGVVAVAGGEGHSLALKSDGTVVAWGSNSAGQTTIPSGLGIVVAIAGGLSHSVALKENGTLVVWGSNSSGQATVPANLGEVLFVASGSGHMLALRDASADASPAIITQPVNTAVTQGQPVTLSVVVSGAPTPTFVWRKNGTSISGATATSYVVASAETSHVGSYDVVISNYRDSVTSHAVALTVNPPTSGTVPSVSTPPQNRTANVGGTVTLNVVATGSPPLIFQWKFSGQPIPGAISATLTLANLQLANSGSYTVTVSNGAGSVTSTPANVVVTNVPGTPVITAQPTGQATTAGADVTLTVSVEGAAPLSFQWHKDGTALSGATASTLTLPQVTLAHAGAYTVRVTNGVGSVMSEIASVTVEPVGTSALHAQLGANFVPGTTVTISNELSYAGAAESLGWEVILPAGWVYVASSGNEGDVKPRTGDTMLLSWAWTTPPASPVAFSYSVNIPASGPRSYSVASLGIVRQAGVAIQLVARPDPLVFDALEWHSADTNHNSRVSLLELTRVIELYNVRRETTRTGSYRVAVTTSEDGFASDPTRSGVPEVSLTNYHSADTDRDGRFSLLELTRVIELYNVRSGSVRTGAYRLQADTEDGFAPGP